MLLQFTDKRFKFAHDLTIGVEFGTKIIPVNNAKIKLQIWDTAGTESFRSITKGYYKGSIGAFLVYDITSKQSFDHVQSWLEELQESASPTMMLCLVGNKADLHDQ